MAAWWPVKPPSCRGSGWPNPFGAARATPCGPGRASSRASCCSGRPIRGSIRTWARLTLDPRRRADVHARMARVARRTAERGGLLGLVRRGWGGERQRWVVGSRGALCHCGAMPLSRRPRWVRWPRCTSAAASSKGSAAGSPTAVPLDWDRAGDVSSLPSAPGARCCSASPSSADLEAVGKVSAEQVPRARGGGRKPEHAPRGDGHSTCRDRPPGPRRRRAQPQRASGARGSRRGIDRRSSGVGSRALMLKEKISVAIAEQKVAEIEAHGREVLLSPWPVSWWGPSGYKTGCAPVPGPRCSTCSTRRSNRCCSPVTAAKHAKPSGGRSTSITSAPRCSRAIAPSRSNAWRRAG